MKLFTFHGGVHPDGHKEATAAKTTATLPLPARLHVPMQQHIGAPAEPCIKIGQRVLKGEIIGRATGPVSAAVHPTSNS